MGRILFGKFDNQYGVLARQTQELDEANRHEDIEDQTFNLRVDQLFILSSHKRALAGLIRGVRCPRFEFEDTLFEITR